MGYDQACGEVTEKAAQSQPGEIVQNTWFSGSSSHPDTRGLLWPLSPGVNSTFPHLFPFQFLAAHIFNPLCSLYYCILLAPVVSPFQEFIISLQGRKGIPGATG